MQWAAPQFEEIALNCEINSYASATLYSTNKPLSVGCAAGPAHVSKTARHRAPGRVYVGTNTEVDVFGLCNVSPNPPCLP